MLSGARPLLREPANHHSRPREDTLKDKSKNLVKFTNRAERAHPGASKQLIRKDARMRELESEVQKDLGRAKRSKSAEAKPKFAIKTRIKLGRTSTSKPPKTVDKTVRADSVLALDKYHVANTVPRGVPSIPLGQLANRREIGYRSFTNHVRSIPAGWTLVMTFNPYMSNGVMWTNLVPNGWGSYLQNPLTMSIPSDATSPWATADAASDFYLSCNVDSLPRPSLAINGEPIGPWSSWDLQRPTFDPFQFPPTIMSNRNSDLREFPQIGTGMQFTIPVGHNPAQSQRYGMPTTTAFQANVTVPFSGQAMVYKVDQASMPRLFGPNSSTDSKCVADPDVNFRAPVCLAGGIGTRGVLDQNFGVPAYTAPRILTGSTVTSNLVVKGVCSGHLLNKHIPMGTSGVYAPQYPLTPLINPPAISLYDPQDITYVSDELMTRNKQQDDSLSVVQTFYPTTRFQGPNVNYDQSALFASPPLFPISTVTEKHTLLDCVHGVPQNESLFGPTQDFTIADSVMRYGTEAMLIFVNNGTTPIVVNAKAVQCYSVLVDPSDQLFPMGVAPVKILDPNPTTPSSIVAWAHSEDDLPADAIHAFRSIYDRLDLPQEVKQASAMSALGTMAGRMVEESAPAPFSAPFLSRIASPVQDVAVKGVSTVSNVLQKAMGISEKVGGALLNVAGEAFGKVAANKIEDAIFSL